ncbi:cell division protein FtsQ/DivIB [Granulicella aggregans]|uniref:cell division protein FtsQ/DivIB n=1 Tax=Granulicella aggregans TaxID=474949 RepID=UPI0021E01534|nr:FtsQ-type POTRA domain-containing protein [Granulicella aggregans]
MLDAPEEMYAPSPAAARRRPRLTEPEPRVDSGRDFDDDFADGLPERVEEAAASSRRQRGGMRFRFNGRPVRLPKTLWGRVASAAGVLLFLGFVTAGVIAVRSFFLHDPRFVIESSSAIESVGNEHVTRAQLLSVFGEDVERNIFNVPLAERRVQLERMPWVEHATVMRLLPNHIRILITERTPVAFVQQGTRSSMVDANGVLLDMPVDGSGDSHYSFPVIMSGIGAEDPLSTRAARMRIFTSFLGDLDSTGEHISQKISEVYLSNPEDVKALIPDGQSSVLVHFGDKDFLDRYRKFEQHLVEWRTQYPKLTSVDMRYDRQVVLDMQPGSEVPVKASSTQVVEQGGKTDAKPVSKLASQQVARPAAKTVAQHPPKPVVKAVAKAPAKPAAKGKQPAKPATEEWHMVVVKPHTKAAAALVAKAKPSHSPQASPQ